MFDAEHRALTSGIVLGVTMIAFEGLAVVTVAPRFATELGGLHLYGWVFSGFLLASLLGTVVAGVAADRLGVGRPFVAGLLVFALGLAVSGLAGDMTVLIFGRALQGLGGGALGTAIYVAVTRAYEDALRSRMMALMSSAWVLPGLLGPALAGLLAETVGWRAVFLALLPLPLLVVLLTLPTFRNLARAQGAAAGAQGAPKRSDAARIVGAVRLVVGVGLLLGGLGLLETRPLPGLLLAVAGAWLTLPALAALVPHGTLRLRRGLPAVIAARGLFFAAFFAAEAFLALMLTSVHGLSLAVVGAAIATGTLSWTAGAWLQDRLDRRGGSRTRVPRLFVGTVLLTVGLAVQLLALYASRPFPITVGGWMIAGLGIGMAHATSSLLAFERAPDGEDGAVSAALQLADYFGAAVSTGVGGALLALATARGLETRSGILLAFLVGISLAATAVAAARRAALPKELR